MSTEEKNERGKNLAWNLCCDAMLLVFLSIVYWLRGEFSMTPNLLFDELLSSAECGICAEINSGCVLLKVTSTVFDFKWISHPLSAHKNLCRLLFVVSVVFCERENNERIVNNNTFFRSTKPFLQHKNLLKNVWKAFGVKKFIFIKTNCCCQGWRFMNIHGVRVRKQSSRWHHSCNHQIEIYKRWNW